MDESVIARRYARAAYQFASAADAAADVLGDLRAFAARFEESGELRTLLLHPAVPADGKAALIEKCAALPATREILALLMRKGRLALAPLVAREFGHIYRRGAGVVAAELTTAAPLPAEVREEFKAALGRLTGKAVHLETRVDEAVVGGVRLRLGDLVMDGTLLTSLREIRDAMAGGNA